MHELRFKKPVEHIVSIELPASKSLSNRYLVARTMSGIKAIEIYNLSGSRDTVLLAKALEFKDDPINLIDAGTPLRFMIAVAATLGKTNVITGNESLIKRPVKPLIKALEKCGAEFEFIQKPGFAPIKLIKPIRPFTEIEVDQSLSSQFVSALMLIAPHFAGEKKILLKGEPVSLPYVELTKFVLSKFKVQVHIEPDYIRIAAGSYKQPEEPLLVESDWSAAAFFYGLCACVPGSEFRFENLPKETVQGDSRVRDKFRHLGVMSNIIFPDAMHIHHSSDAQTNNLAYNMKSCPDLAPALITACAVRGLKVRFKGLETLKIKESDRTAVLKANLKKFNILFSQNGEFWDLDAENAVYTPQTIDTAHDHRIAMAFALFAVKCPIKFDDIQCVEKSFPGFWKEWEKCGFGF